MEIVKSCPINILPHELLRLIANYLLNVENQDKFVFQFSHDWRNFMNSKKAYFGRWKKESQLIVLDSPLVETFYSSSTVRERVLQYVENPVKQLELYFSSDDENRAVDLKLIDYVKRISLYVRRLFLTRQTYRKLNWKTVELTPLPSQ
jgi:hypothetical protein